MNPYILVFFLGAILGMAYDSIHVYFNVLHYSHPHFWGESLWVFPEFGMAGFVFLFAMNSVANKLGKFKETTLQNCFYNGLLLLIGYLVTGIFAGDNVLTLLILLPLAFITLYFHKEKREKIIIFLTALWGPANEYIISSLGFFKYNHSNYIPIWLPVLWIIAAGLFLELSKYLLQINKN